jgi:tetratricopeptide (TPR) repeat protein
VSVDPRVTELIGLWQQQREQGLRPTPEELCRACPELLEAVKRGLAELRPQEVLISTVAEEPARPAAGPGAAAAACPAPAGWDLPGRRYQPRRFHARGGLGEVYVAEDVELHRDVALKRIRPPQADDADSRRRFLREAEITARLQHPGIVPVYGLVADDLGRPCYAMRFVEGASLKDAVENFHRADRAGRDPGERRLALRALLAAFAAACKTLAYAHSRGVVHCDLKPANIMLGGYGETPLLLAVATRLTGREGNAVALLTEARRRHPDDFWVNFGLGNALAMAGHPAEAVGPYRVAEALRPGTAAVRVSLGSALTFAGRVDEALAELDRALALEPDNPQAHSNRGLALYHRGRHVEAAAAFRRALALEPGAALLYTNLGAALAGQGRPAEAADAFRQALAMGLDDPSTRHNLGLALAAQGRTAQAVEQYRQALAHAPNFAPAHFELGVILKQTGRSDEARAEFQQAATLSPGHALAHFNLGVVLDDVGRLDEAIAEYRRSVALDPRDAPSYLNLGVALTDKGRPQDAVAAFRQALALDARLVGAHGGLGQALLRVGGFAEARDATRGDLELLPQGDPLRGRLTRQLQQCERLLALEPKLARLLRGEAQPADVSERLLLAQACQYKQLHAAAAGHYAVGIGAAPELLQDPRSGLRYEAAWSAALAGCGRAADDAWLDDRERTRLRRQALDWLTADLALWSGLATGGDPKARDQARRRRRRWQSDAQFDGLRDAAALARLPEEEGQACRKLWADVQAVLTRAGLPGRP